ncbi:neural cell adhesion molecule 1-like [Haemaphysalis longicornis]
MTASLFPVPPSISRRNLTTRLKIVEGARATLHCPAQGRPPPTIVWMRGSEVLSPDDPRLESSGSLHSLVIRSAQLRDRKFTCIARNAAGTAQVDFTLDVTVPPKLETSDEQSVVAVLHREAWLRCPVGGVPPPSVRWLKAGRLVSHRGDPFVQPSADGRRLHLRRARLRDAGNYTCLAINDAGKLEQLFTVEVQVPPQISSLPSAEVADERVHVVENETLSLQCRAMAQPRARVIWMKDSVPIKGPRQKRRSKGATKPVARSLGLNTSTCHEREERAMPVLPAASVTMPSLLRNGSHYPGSRRNHKTGRATSSIPPAAPSGMLATTSSPFYCQL